MPFRVPWTDGAAEPGFAGEFVRHHLSHREGWQPGCWTLELGVWHGGRPAGFQTLRGTDFAALRTVETGSWLGREHQRQGLGTEMREAVLELAFAGLGAAAAAAAASGGFDWNAASLRVSEKLGYRVVGEETVAPRGEPQREVTMRLGRVEWGRREHPPVGVEGLEPCLPLFGLTAGA